MNDSVHAAVSEGSASEANAVSAVGVVAGTPRRVDWRTMSLKLADAVAGLLRDPDDAGAREWAARMVVRTQEMIENEASLRQGTDITGENGR